MASPVQTLARMKDRSLVVIALSLALTHCYSTFDVTPRAVERLDGFKAGEQRKLEGTDGEVTFDRNTSVTFDVVGAPPVSAQFSRIVVGDSVFDGVERASREHVVVNLTRVHTVSATNFSLSKTVVAAVVASVLGTVVLGVLLLWAGLATSDGPIY